MQATVSAATAAVFGHPVLPNGQLPRLVDPACEWSGTPEPSNVSDEVSSSPRASAIRYTVSLPYRPLRCAQLSSGTRCRLRRGFVVCVRRVSVALALAWLPLPAPRLPLSLPLPLPLPAPPVLLPPSCRPCYSTVPGYAFMY